MAQLQECSTDHVTNFDTRHGLVDPLSRERPRGGPAAARPRSATQGGRSLGSFSLGDGPEGQENHALCSL